VQVTEEHDPSSQGKDANYIACNETRTGDLWSCVEALAEDNSEEAAGDGTNQDDKTGFVERQAQ